MSNLPSDFLALRRERTTTTGVLALFVHEYLRENTDDVGPVVPDLHIWSTAGTERARYHASTALYGFLRLSHLDNPHRLHFVDPSGRWLPRAWTLDDVPDRSQLRAVLEAGGHPLSGAAWAEPITPREVPLYPSVSNPVHPGDTVLWGQLLDDTGRPAPFARVEVSTDSQVVVSYSDLQGAYLVRLRGERAAFVVPEPPEDDGLPPEEDGLPPLDEEDEPVPELTDSFTFTVRLWKLQATLQPGVDPLRSFPADFDSLGADAAALAAAYHPHDPPIDTTVHIGRRNRLDHTFAPTP